MDKQKIKDCYKEVQDEQERIVRILESNGYAVHKRDIDLFPNGGKHLGNIWISIPIFAD